MINEQKHDFFDIGELNGLLGEEIEDFIDKSGILLLKKIMVQEMNNNVRIIIIDFDYKGKLMKMWVNISKHNIYVSGECHSKNKKAINQMDQIGKEIIRYLFEQSSIRKELNTLKPQVTYWIKRPWFIKRLIRNFRMYFLR